MVMESFGDQFFLFSFSSKSDMIKAWSRGTVYLEGECLLVRRLSLRLQLDIKIMSCVLCTIVFQNKRCCPTWKKDKSLY